MGTSLFTFGQKTCFSSFFSNHCYLKVRLSIGENMEPYMEYGMELSNPTFPTIDQNTPAFSHAPEHGFSLFLENRTKIIHFIRHAEGTHNEANHAYGDDTPCQFTTEGSWQYMDAKLTDKGIKQCLVQLKEMGKVQPELIIVSPFTRTLQTAHIMFGGKDCPFMVHDLCRERWGLYTCDKRRKKQEILQEFEAIYAHTNDHIDFTTFGYATEEDEDWTDAREPADHVTNRGIQMMQWLATRPEKEIAVVTHSSWLKHLFRAFGESVNTKDKETMHRLAGNAEVRSICLALHHGFYPEGNWIGDTNVFVPTCPSFRKGRWAPTSDSIAEMHTTLRKKH